MPNSNSPPSTAARPEWARVPDIVRLFGLGKSSVYNLIVDGKVKTCSVPIRGKAGKIRLVHVPSVEALLNSVATGGSSQLPSPIPAKEVQP